MKRLILAGTAILALAACTQSSTVSYDLTFRVDDPALQQQLTEQSLRVVERRLFLMQEDILDKSVQTGSGTARITIKTEHPEATDALTDDLTSPFEFAIMKEVPAGSGADITVEGHGGFAATDIGNDDLNWVQARTQPGTTKGEVRLVFTEEGRAKMAALFEEMNGKNIAIFVRDRLVSKMRVDSEELQDDIVIQDIPDPALAQVFSDDLNVGINVTFTPVP